MSVRPEGEAAEGREVAEPSGGPRLAVWEAPPRLTPGDAAWKRLRAELGRLTPDLLLLNEMPFGAWIAAAPDPDPEALAETRRAHAEGLERLGELGVPTVLGSRPTLDDRGRSVNEAFAWSAETGLMPLHTKQFFPDEEGYWEVRWFRRGDLRFRSVPIPVKDRPVRVGSLVCTDVWFNEWARRYGRQGADLLIVPRATPPDTADRWKTAVRMAALVAGSWAASSNRGGADPETGQLFGGGGWIFDPDGTLAAETSPETPVAVSELDLSRGIRAKREYPRYVEELPEPSADES